MIKKLQKLKAKKGFTLVELIVVIAIIGVLAAILIPTMLGFVTNSRVTSANTTASEVQKQINQFLTDSDTAGYGPLKGTIAIEISGGTWNVTVSDPTAFKTGNAITWTASGTGTAGATKVGVKNATDLLAINLADLFPSVSNGAINANVISGSCTAVWYTADASTVAAVTGAPGFGADAQHAWATDPFAWDNSTAGITTDGFTVGTAPVLSLG